MWVPKSNMDTTEQGQDTLFLVRVGVLMARKGVPLFNAMVSKYKKNKKTDSITA